MRYGNALVSVDEYLCYIRMYPGEKRAGVSNRDSDNTVNNVWLQATTSPGYY
jgi:hypothetical protein